MVDLRSLEVFFWVVKLGGFGRAAERLRVTQPAVSGRISQIEARFNVRLLDRNGHRAAVPTPKGAELFAYAERMLALNSELISRLSATADLSGTLRIGVAETLVHTLLGTLLRQLHQRHPLVTPEITVDISPNLHAGLLTGELDVALLLGPLIEPRVRNVLLQDYPLAWVASPALMLNGPISLLELARWPLLSYARGTLPHAQILELFSQPSLPPVRVFANSSLATIVHMAVDGIGIGVLPHAVVARDLAEQRLQLLEVEPLLPPLRFTASYLAASPGSLAEVVAKLAGEITHTT